MITASKTATTTTADIPFYDCDSLIVSLITMMLLLLLLLLLFLMMMMMMMMMMRRMMMTIQCGIEVSGSGAEGSIIIDNY